MMIATVGWLLLMLDKYAFTSTTGTALLLVGLGSCFIFAKNDTLINVGYLLCMFEGAYGISFIFTSDTLNGVTIIGIGLLCVFIGSVLYYLKGILSFLGFSSNGDACSSSDGLITSLTKLKDMQSEDVISDDEYSSLKGAMLEKSVNKKMSFDDLKKWKKLLDRKVITDEEFAALKSKAFGK